MKNCDSSRFLEWLIIWNGGSIWYISKIIIWCLDSLFTLYAVIYFCTSVIWFWFQVKLLYDIPVRLLYGVWTACLPCMQLYIYVRVSYSFDWRFLRSFVIRWCWFLLCYCQLVLYTLQSGHFFLFRPFDSVLYCALSCAVILALSWWL